EWPTAGSIARSAPLSLSFPLRTGCHENQHYQLFGRRIPDAMFLSRPCNHGLTRTQLLFFACNVEQPSTPKNEVDLIRFLVSVNPLILAGLQAIDVAEVLRRFE